MNIKNKIAIYTNTNCPYCKTIKEELTKNKIEFEEITTIDNKDKWKQVHQLTGIPTVPTIHYKDNYL